MCLKGLLIPVCLLLSAAGCATKPITVREIETVEVVRYETVPVPAALLQPCGKSLQESFHGLATNGDLERFAAELIVSLQLCNADKEAIRALE
jgi:hypothetical protein